MRFFTALALLLVGVVGGALRRAFGAVEGKGRTLARGQRPSHSWRHRVRASAERPAAWRAGLPSADVSLHSLVVGASQRRSSSRPEERSVCRCGCAINLYAPLPKPVFVPWVHDGESCGAPLRPAHSLAGAPRFWPDPCPSTRAVAWGHAPSPHSVAASVSAFQTRFHSQARVSSMSYNAW